MKKKMLANCMVLLLLLGAEQAFALGTIEMTEPAAVVESYPYQAQIELPRSVELRIGAGGQFDRSYTIGFTPGQSGNPSNRQLYNASGGSIPYRLVDNPGGGNDLKDLDDADPTGLLRGVVPRGTTVTESFYVLIPGGAVPQPGNYSDAVTLRAYDFQNDEVATATLSVEVTVPAVITLSLAPPGGAFDPDAKSYDLDFGVLEEGESGYLDMIVRSNAAYSVEFSSTNNGRFAHVDPGITSFVPYEFFFGNDTVRLRDGPAVVLVAGGETPAAGRRHPIEIRVGELESATSGLHRDIITVSVTVN